MKLIIKLKIFFLLIALTILSHAQSQVLSIAEKNKIVKDLQEGIKILATTSSKGLEELTNYGAGVIAKDSNMLLYKADYVELMYADEYYVFSYFKDSLNLYCCNYTNNASILIAEKAIKSLVKNEPQKWKLLAGKSVPDNDNVKYIFYNNKKVAYYKKTIDNKFLQICFINYLKNSSEISIGNKEKNSNNEFLNNVNNQLENIDKTILKTDIDKEKEIQNALIMVITEGNNWFTKNIANQTTQDTTTLYYDVSANDKMYAQQYYGKKLLKDKSMYYVCAYTIPQSIVLAIKAIDGLPALKNSEWILLKYVDKNGDIAQRIYFKGIDVGNTIHYKKGSRFEVEIKKVE